MPWYRVKVQETYTTEVLAESEEEAKELAFDTEDPEYDSQEIIAIQEIPTPAWYRR